MAEYEIREEKRPAIEAKIDDWLREEGILHLEVCRKRGRSHSKIADSEIDADELQELGSGDAILDRVCELVMGMSGKMELRLRYKDYNKTGGRSDDHKAFHMHRVREPSTKSQGSSAATEQLATSLAGAFDQQAARAESRDERYTEFLSQTMMRMEDSSERRLSEHTQYQIEVMRLRDELSRKDLEIALIEATSGLPPELWAEVFKASVPVVTQLIGSVSVAVSAWGRSYSPAIGDGAAAISTPTPPRGPEEAPGHTGAPTPDAPQT